jgi:hypothetical protein
MSNDTTMFRVANSSTFHLTEAQFLKVKQARRTCRTPGRPSMLNAGPAICRIFTAISSYSPGPGSCARCDADSDSRIRPPMVYAGPSALPSNLHIRDNNPQLVICSSLINSLPLVSFIIVHTRGGLTAVVQRSRPAQDGSPLAAPPRASHQTCKPARFGPRHPKR